jgi:hypothetical protein
MMAIERSSELGLMAKVDKDGARKSRLAKGLSRPDSCKDFVPFTARGSPTGVPENNRHYGPKLSARDHNRV